jgi:DNA polymerase-3 subunit gamma/tau
MKEKIDDALAVRILGVGNRKNVENLVRAISSKEYSTIYKIISETVLSSKDLSVFWRELIDYYRDLLLIKLMPMEEAKSYLDLTDTEIESISALEKSFSMEQLLYHSRLLEEAFISMQKIDVSKQSIVELFLTRMCEPKLSVSPESMLLRISELEKQISLIRIGEFSQSTEARKSETPEKKPLPKEEKKAEPIRDKKENKTSAEKQPSDFRSCGAWSEIVEEVAKTKASLAGLLAGTRCYASPDGVYVIKAKNKFVGGQIMKDADTLKCAILTVEGKMPADLAFDIEAEDSSFSLIKELEDKI